MRATTPSVQADRPGVGTGTTLLEYTHIQWETGFELARTQHKYAVLLPTTLFRFGLPKRAELRLEYNGMLTKHQYEAEPLLLGTKILLWNQGNKRSLAWIPRTCLMLNLGLPLTHTMAKELPVSGMADLLFENEVTEWFSVGYDLGAQWFRWQAEPDIAASLSLNFTPTDKIGIFVESYNYFQFNLPADADHPTTTPIVYNINLDFGITYMPHPLLQLDAHAGFNCYHTYYDHNNPENHAFVGIGIAWLLHHTDDDEQ